MEVWNTVSMRPQQFIPIPSQAPSIAEYRDDRESWEVPLLLMSQLEAKLMNARGLSLRIMRQLGSGWTLTPLTTSRRQTLRSSSQ